MEVLAILGRKKLKDVDSFTEADRSNWNKGLDVHCHESRDTRKIVLGIR